MHDEHSSFVYIDVTGKNSWTELIYILIKASIRYDGKSYQISLNMMNTSFFKTMHQLQIIMIVFVKWLSRVIYFDIVKVFDNHECHIN